MDIIGLTKTQHTMQGGYGVRSSCRKIATMYMVVHKSENNKKKSGTKHTTGCNKRERGREDERRDG